ncbi:MAG: ABC transporter ATP-binding protein [Variibacter sp.]|nr:ABC transporter ATP-binding protein [Variibacter sp.]
MATSIGAGHGSEAEGATPVVLDVRNMGVSYRTASGFIHAVEDVSFSVRQGEYLGLVGESGCGKSTIAKAILRLLPEDSVVSGQAILQGEDLLALPERELRRVRWSKLSVITQSSMNALDPVFRLSDQFYEAFRAHLPRISRAEAKDKAGKLFEMVGILPARLDDYPHQFSGGMKQRAVIALALALNPTLIIADEPTTALDVIMQDQIMARIHRIHKEFDKSMILITHDMALIAENCDHVAVMYAGQVAEYGTVKELFDRPFHPYARGLRHAFPKLGSEGHELVSIAGAPPVLSAAIAGCRFAPRCPFQTTLCRTVSPPLARIGPDHVSRCHYPDRAEEFRAASANPVTWMRADTGAEARP